MQHALPDAPARLAQVWAALAPVTDPELDESVTELRFVNAVEVDGTGHVHVAFRLPTYWCAANFAYLMADDMRRAVAALPWVSGVTIVLDDHMYGAEINAGLARGASFKDTFGEAAVDEDLETLRHNFRVKAFQRRQEAVISHLLASGWPEGEIVAIRRGGLAKLAIADPAAARMRDRYIAIRGELGGPSEAAFTTPEGEPVTAAGLGAHLLALRRARVNIDFNGSLCRGLLRARYPDTPAEDGEPTLHDFIREAQAQVQAQAQANAQAARG